MIIMVLSVWLPTVAIEARTYARIGQCNLFTYGRKLGLLIGFKIRPRMLHLKTFQLELFYLFLRPEKSLIYRYKVNTYGRKTSHLQL